MMLIILMCCLTLTNSVLGDVSDANQNGDTGGESNSEETNSGSSQNFSNTTKGFIPPLEHEFFDTKHGRVRTVRSVGKTVDLPADVVRRMKDTPISALSGSLSEIQKIIIETHNRFRSQVSPSARNMMKMKWNENAQKTASAYAKQCKEEHSPVKMRTIHNPDMTCGENLFLSPYKLPWEYVIEFWYNEHKDFIYAKGSKSPSDVIGHYKQLAWAASHLLGCDMWKCDNLPNCHIYVCHYCPAGNRGDKTRPYSEGPPCSDCPKSCDGGKLCTNGCPEENKFNDCDTYNTNNACVTDRSMVSDCPATCKCTNGEIR